MVKFVDYFGLDAADFKALYKKFGLTVKANGHFTDESEEILNSFPSTEAGFQLRRLLRRHNLKARTATKEQADAKKPKKTKVGGFFKLPIPTDKERSRSTATAKTKKRMTAKAGATFFPPAEPRHPYEMAQEVARHLKRAKAKKPK